MIHGRYLILIDVFINKCTKMSHFFLFFSDLYQPFHRTGLYVHALFHMFSLSPVCMLSCAVDNSNILLVCIQICKFGGDRFGERGDIFGSM